MYGTGTGYPYSQIISLNLYSVSTQLFQNSVDLTNVDKIKNIFLPRATNAILPVLWSRKDPQRMRFWLQTLCSTYVD
jgi:hypothetical protein